MGQGPLDGVKVIEFAGIGPGPFCGMLLSDLGAEVVRIDRKGGPVGGARPVIDRFSVTLRGRRSVALDLTHPDAVAACLSLAENADIVFEGFRPGVMEKLGLGPEVMLQRNPRLVYGRMTGWGQSGPLSRAAGHDINYIAITGALHAIGTQDKPVPPLNLVGDFGGGALYLAFGMLAALTCARTTGRGQVVDAAMSDGVASLLAPFYGLHALGAWTSIRQDNLLDGGAHFYDTYRCADGKWVALGAIEPKFYALLLKKAELTDDQFANQLDRAAWPALKAKLAEAMARRTRDEWCELMEGSDVCFAPVLDFDEAPRHAHNRAREAYLDIDGVVQPAPAPRFSATPGRVQGPPSPVGAHTEAVLREWGLSAQTVAALQACGAADGG